MARTRSHARRRAAPRRRGRGVSRKRTTRRKTRKTVRRGGSLATALRMGAMALPVAEMAARHAYHREHPPKVFMVDDFMGEMVPMDGQEPSQVKGTKGPWFAQLPRKSSSGACQSQLRHLLTNTGTRFLDRPFSKAKSGRRESKDSWHSLRSPSYLWKRKERVKVPGGSRC